MQNNQDRLTKGLLLGFSLAVLFLLAYAAYDENFAGDWYRYQSLYRRQLIKQAGNERDRESAERFTVGQKQLYLPNLDRIDRCITCHISIDNPAMKDADQPLKAHPGDTMLNHPKETFGCTICHKGQGRATTAADAHGHVHNWTEPMLAQEEMDQSCAKCHTERSLPGAARYSQAMDLFYEHSCLSCHRVRGQGGNIAADISDAGIIHDAKWHFKHFKDPKSVVETSEMPKLDLSDEGSQLLTFLMMCYRGESIPTELLSNSGPQTAQMKLPEPLDAMALAGYVGSKFCISCHGATHPDTVKNWRESKMASTYERIRSEPVKDNCLPCHSTALNSETGHFSEEGVGCEACHGPGKEAVRLIMANKTIEHKEMVRIDRNSKLVCAQCHNPHMPKTDHAEFYRKLASPASYSQTSREPSPPTQRQHTALTKPEPVAEKPIVEEQVSATIEREHIPSPGLREVAEKSISEEQVGAMTELDDLGSVGSQSVAVNPIAQTKPPLATKGNRLSHNMLSTPISSEGLSIPPLAVFHSTSAGQPPDTITQGCVSGECHLDTMAGAVTHGPVAQQECGLCHQLVDEKNHKFEATMKEPDLCFSCHEAPMATQFEHGPVALGVCTVCHNPHSSANKYMLPAMGRALCFKCHAGIEETMNGTSVRHGDIREKDCTACHDPHRSNFRRQLKGEMPGLCFECHEPIRELDNAVIVHEPVKTEAKCANCHNPHGSNVPKLLKDNEIDLCLSCHDKPMQTPSGPIVNMKALLENNPEHHGPIREGNCTGCHQPHGSQNFRLLSHAYPPRLYSPFSIEVYKLCFQCHEETLVLNERTATLTDFRNGTTNLHYIHVNQTKGRTCGACHEVHAGTKTKRMKDSVQFGEWLCPIKFEETESGGNCAPGCHVPRGYDRGQAIIQR